MKVLHVLRPAAGGMRTHLLHLASGLAPLGVSCRLAAPERLETAAFALQTEAPIAARTRVLADLRVAASLRVEARDCSLIHGHGLRGGWIAALAAAFAKRPFVVTLHNLPPQEAGLAARAALGWMLRRAKQSVCVSEAIRDSLPEEFVTSSGTVVIPNGIDLSPFETRFERSGARAAFGIGQDDFMVAAAGRLEPEKGFEALVRAAAMAPASFGQLRVLIAGEGSRREILETLRRDLGAEGRVRLLGRIEDIPALFRAADLVAVPSLSEGQGIVAVEAMAASRAVVASRTGGLPETVVEGATGLLVPPGDSAALAKAIVRLWEEDVLRKRLGKAGEERARSLFSREAMCRQTLEIYVAALG